MDLNLNILGEYGVHKTNLSPEINYFYFIHLMTLTLQYTPLSHMDHTSPPSITTRATGEKRHKSARY